MDTLSEILSKAPELESGYLKRINCMSTQFFAYHYYPQYPAPDQTLGATKHSDQAFLTIVLQDDRGSLQVWYKDYWVDVSPIQRAFVVNIGDLLQLITNGKFKSVEHWVLASHGGTRLSVACFLPLSMYTDERVHGIEELLSEGEPPRYKSVRMREYMQHYNSKGLAGKGALKDFQL